MNIVEKIGGYMAQYCKYCAHFIEGDCFFCVYKDEVLGDKQIHYTNKCKYYIESELGSIVDGKKYKPRKKKEKDNINNLTIYDFT